MSDRHVLTDLQKKIEALEDALSEQKRINAELKKDQARLELLYERAPLGYQSLDENGCFLEVNQAWLDLFGYSRDEVIGRPFSNFLHPDWMPHFKKNFPRFKAAGEISGVEFEMIRKNGRPIAVSFYGRIGKKPDGNFQQTHCIVQDITDRKKNDTALRESEERYRSLFENAQDAIFVADPDSGTLLDVNASAEALTGYSKKELIGKHQTFIHPPGDTEFYRNEFQRAAGAKGAKFVEMMVQRKDGKQVPVEINSGGTISVGSKKLHIGIFRDISDRRKAEQALRESESRYRTILESSPILFVIHQEGIIEYINEAGCAILGRKKPSDLEGRMIFDFVHPEYTSLVQKRFVNLKTGHTNPPEDIGILRDDGEFVMLQSTSLPIHYKGKAAALIMSVDLTERKKAENENKKQKRLFETMFNTIPDGVVITNTRREIQLANKGMETTFGYKPEELLGNTTEMLYADRGTYQQAGRVVFDEGAETPGNLYVTRYRKKDGQEFSGETFGAKLFDEDNRWIGNLGIMRDITEREQAELRIQQAQKMESIGNLAGGIAHDFNNILFPIVGMAEMLMEDLPRGSLERENASEILQAGKRGSSLVKQILAFSRRSGYKLRPVRVQQVLKEVLNLTRATIPSYIDVDHDIQSDCGPILADAAQIHQVAMNMITNAYHAVESGGGKIHIQLKETELTAADRPGDSLKPGRYAVLTISDNGHGIAPDNMSKIFEPYFTTKKQGKGTGFGLAVAYGIVKKQEGEIKVYSELGKGTTFDVFWPLTHKAAEAGSAEMENEHPAGNATILLIDDEVSIINLERQMLERLGYKVASFTDSPEAVKAFKADSSAIDLVITDMTMPHMTGVQLAREVLSIRPEIPIAICTGFNDGIDEEKARKMGIKGFLMKPVEKNELARMIRELLHKPVTQV